MHLILIAAAVVAAPPQSSSERTPSDLSTDGLPIRALPSTDVFDTTGPKDRDPRVAVPTAADFAHERDLVAEVRDHPSRPGSPTESIDPAPLRVRDWQTPIYDDLAVPGHVFVRGRSWKAEFSPDGLAYTPALGRAAAVNQTFRFTLASATVGGTGLELGPGAVSRNGDSVSLDHGPIRETFHIDLDEIEQTFVLNELPSREELTVDVRVDAPWFAVVDGPDLRFDHPEFGAVTYGDAFALDADGRRVAIEREWTGTSIRMTVPEDFILAAELPITIDPPIGTQFNNGFGTADDTEPDVTYDANSGFYWVTWEDFTSASDADCYVTRVNPSGLQGTTLVVDLTADAWRDPALAAAPGSSRVLIVAAVTPGGGGSSDIEGRYVDTNQDTIVGAPFNIDGVPQDCVTPDVGGTAITTPTQSEFCVVWERVFNASDHDIHARLVDVDTGFGTPPIFLSNAAVDNDFAPAVSQSQGDQLAFGDFWNVAWIRDDDGNGRGQPWTDRIYLDGSNNGSLQFPAFNTQVANRVDVTSTMTDVLGDTADRPWIVTFYREVNGGDIYTTICTQNTARGSNVVSELEDFDVSLDQREPRIAGTGTGFLLTYTEQGLPGPGSNPFDVYMVSGSIGESSTGAYLALGERHETLASGPRREFLSAVCSDFDGGGTGNRGMAVWVDEVSNSQGGTIEGRRLEVDGPSTSARHAVGLQYCEANAHGDSGAGGRESSFISAFGSQSVVTSHELRCEDMKRNSFAFFICSRTSANVNMPGGSAGRLCLGGSVGRVVGGQIQTTGSSGSITVQFSPQLLPTPTGTVAAQPGETWSFQCWHRDTQNGMSTSNFSNGCRIRFRP